MEAILMPSDSNCKHNCHDHMTGLCNRKRCKYPRCRRKIDITIPDPEYKKRQLHNNIVYLVITVHILLLVKIVLSGRYCILMLLERIPDNPLMFRYAFIEIFFAIVIAMTLSFLKPKTS